MHTDSLKGRNETETMGGNYRETYLNSDGKQSFSGSVGKDDIS